MLPEERKAIHSFMQLVLEEIHPNWREYPLDEMVIVEDSSGEGFEGTKYEGIDYVIHAFYMRKAIAVF